MWFGRSARAVVRDLLAPAVKQPSEGDAERDREHPEAAGRKWWCWWKWRHCSSSRWSAETDLHHATRARSAHRWLYGRGCGFLLSAIRWGDGEPRGHPRNRSDADRRPVRAGAARDPADRPLRRRAADHGHRVGRPAGADTGCSSSAASTATSAPGSRSCGGCGRCAPPQTIDLWLVPTLNPDGRAADTRQNGHGVDLNRNFAAGVGGERRAVEHVLPGPAAVLRARDARRPAADRARPPDALGLVPPAPDGSCGRGAAAPPRPAATPHMVGLRAVPEPQPGRHGVAVAEPALPRRRLVRGRAARRADVSAPPSPDTSRPSWRSRGSFTRCPPTPSRSRSRPPRCTPAGTSSSPAPAIPRGPERRPSSSRSWSSRRWRRSPGRWTGRRCPTWPHRRRPSSSTSPCSRPPTGARRCRSSIRSPAASRRCSCCSTAAVATGFVPTPLEIGGVVAVATGVLLVRGVARGGDLWATAMAVGIAATIACYTVVDKSGLHARRHDPVLRGRAGDAGHRVRERACGRPRAGRDPRRLLALVGGRGPGDVRRLRPRARRAAPGAGRIGGCGARDERRRWRPPSPPSICTSTSRGTRAAGAVLVCAGVVALALT